MAHFARVVDGTVVQVIVVNNSEILDADGNESEEIGKAFIASIGLDGEWVQTSFSSGFRGAYAGAGYSYDSDSDVFVAPLAVEP